MPEEPSKGLRARSTCNETQEKRLKYMENLIIGGMNKKESALAAGFSLSMARKPGARIENTPVMLEAMERLDQALLKKIPTEVLAEKFAEGLEATVHKTAQKDGSITDVKEFPDYATRLRYIEKIALMSRRYQPKTTTEVTGKDGGPIEVTPLKDEELEQRKQWLERELGIGQPSSHDGRALPPAKGGSEAG